MRLLQKMPSLRDFLTFFVVLPHRKTVFFTFAVGMLLFFPGFAENIPNESSSKEDRPLAPLDAMLEAYGRGSYAEVRKFAGSVSNTPEGRLVLALCKVYDRSRLDLVRGCNELQSIFNDAAVSRRVRVEAGLALGRVIQLMKERPDQYEDFPEHFDHERILRGVMELSPGTASNRAAFFYLFQEKVRNPRLADKAFAEAEKYIADFPGPRRLLVPLMSLLEYEYVVVRGDYVRAVQTLEEAYKLGFSNPTEERSALFLIGFYYYKNLKNREKAVHWLELYCKKYPFSVFASVARRYLGELSENSGKGVKNHAR